MGINGGVGFGQLHPARENTTIKATEKTVRCDQVIGIGFRHVGEVIQTQHRGRLGLSPLMQLLQQRHRIRNRRQRMGDVQHHGAHPRLWFLDVLCQLLGHTIGVQQTGIESRPGRGAKAHLGQCLCLRIRATPIGEKSLHQRHGLPTDHHLAQIKHQVQGGKTIHFSWRNKPAVEASKPCISGLSQRLARSRAKVLPNSTPY